jgi:hypothetical protein
MFFISLGGFTYFIWLQIAYVVQNNLGALRAKEAIEQDGKDDAAHHDVEFVFLGGEAEDTKRNPHDRRCNQNQYAQPYDAATIEAVID